MLFKVFSSIKEGIERIKVKRNQTMLYASKNGEAYAKESPRKKYKNDMIIPIE
jgi:hypothetical protein